jgi:hypothetical protein
MESDHLTLLGRLAVTPVIGRNCRAIGQTPVSNDPVPA